MTAAVINNIKDFEALAEITSQIDENKKDHTKLLQLVSNMHAQIEKMLGAQAHLVYAPNDDEAA